MSKVEYTFVDYVRLMNRFFNGDAVIKEAIEKSAEKSKRSVVNEVLEVKEAIRKLEIVMKMHAPKRDDSRTEGRLNPFNGVMVEIDHGILRGNRIKARKMKNSEFSAYYFGK